MSKKISNVLKWSIAILVLAVVIYFLNNSKILHKVKHLDTFIFYIRSQGKYAYAVFLAIFALKPLVLVVPSNIMSISSGIIFGPLTGILLNTLGFFISGTLAFFIARFLGQEAVNKILKGKALNLNNKLEGKGFKVLFFLRLLPVLPFDPVSYAAGLSKVKYGDFIIASVLGVLPEIICYSIIGENAKNPLSPQFLIPLIVIILATVISGIVVKKQNSSK